MSPDGGSTGAHNKSFWGNSRAGSKVKGIGKALEGVRDNNTRVCVQLPAVLRKAVPSTHTGEGELRLQRGGGAGCYIDMLLRMNLFHRVSQGPLLRRPTLPSTPALQDQSGGSLLSSQW